jgi:septum formation protein
MSRKGQRLILASASPRRADILAKLGIDVEVMPTHADEASLNVFDDATFVREAALLKLRSALDAGPAEGRFILSADTIVSVGDERLGKPKDSDEAVAMLRKLAGRDHIVRTAVALGKVGAGELDCRVVATRVWFRKATDDDLHRYVCRGESADKAGAYGIQGVASGFVTHLEGSYSNVVGLPASEVVDLLLEHGALEQWP